MTQVLEFVPRVGQGPTYLVNIMNADVLVAQGARASGTMIFTTC